MTTTPDRPAAGSSTDPAGFAIICVNYGSHDLLASNLTDDVIAAAGGAEVILVDSFHSVPARRATERLCRERGWTLIPCDRNVGFGVGANIGVERAIKSGHKWFVIMNPDVCAAGEVLRGLVEVLRAHPLSLVSPLILRPDGGQWFTGGRIDARTGRVTGRAAITGNQPDEWLTGACLTTSVTMWELLGGFDPEYFLYWEDVDLSTRAVRVGGALRVADDLLVTHAPGGTQGTGAHKSSTYIYHNCRNPLLYAAKHLDAKEQWSWARAAPSNSVRVMLRGDCHTVRGIAVSLTAALRGTTAGFRMLVIRRLAGEPRRSTLRLPGQ